MARVLIARGFDPKKRDLLGATLLHVATLRGHTELVKELLHLGVEPAQVDRYGSTATELATKPEVNFIFEKHHEKCAPRPSLLVSSDWVVADPAMRGLAQGGS